MSAAKHTRGPWTLTHVAGSNFAVQEFRIKAPFGNTPNVYPIFNRNTSGIDDASVFISPENAHLIAAAPELLKELHAARAYIQKQCDCLHDSHVNPATGKLVPADVMDEDLALLGRIDAAIAKAIGSAS